MDPPPSYTWTSTASTTTNNVWIDWACIVPTTITGTSSVEVSPPWIIQPATFYSSDWCPIAKPDPIKELKGKIKQRRVRHTAKNLLKRIVGDVLFQDWETYGSLRFPHPDGSIFEINPFWDGMVYQICSRTMKPMRKLCIHPPTNFPLEDRVAALYLHLMAMSERKILKTANRHRFSVREPDWVIKRRRNTKRRVDHISNDTPAFEYAVGS